MTKTRHPKKFVITQNPSSQRKLGPRKNPERLPSMDNWIAASCGNDGHSKTTRHDKKIRHPKKPSSQRKLGPRNYIS